MSSLVNKSGKIFAPKKAPRRRRRTPTPPVVVTRKDVEDVQAQTNTSHADISAITAHAELEVTQEIEQDGTTIISTVAPTNVAEEIVESLEANVKAQHLNQKSPTPRVLVTRSSEALPRSSEPAAEGQESRPAGNVQREDAGVNPQPTSAPDVRITVNAASDDPLNKSVNDNSEATEAVRIEIPPRHIVEGSEVQAVTILPETEDAPTLASEPTPAKPSSPKRIRSKTASPKATRKDAKTQAKSSTADTVMPSIEEPPPVERSPAKKGKETGWTKRGAKQTVNSANTDANASTRKVTKPAPKTSKRKAAAMEEDATSKQPTPPAEDPGTLTIVSSTAADYRGAKRPRTDKGVSKRKRQKSVEAQASAGAAADEAQAEESVPAVMSARQRNAQKRKEKAAARNGATNGLTVDGLEEGVVTKATVQRLEVAKKAAYGAKGAKKTKKKTTPEQSDAAQIPDGGPVRDGSTPASSRSRSETPGGTKRPGRRRASTPEGAEEVTIVESMVTMWELAARNVRTGKKSNRERQMAKLDWTAIKARRKSEERQMALNRGRPPRSRSNSPEAAARVGADGEVEELDDDDIDEQLARAAEKNKKRQKIVLTKMGMDGQHFIDETSLVIDRHALANDEIELEEIEEDDLTKHFNSKTYQCLRRKEPAERIRNWDRWTEELTDQFYDYLGRFGTDFMILSRMFPGRTRREIKAKFVREERLDPERIKNALTGSLIAGPDTWDIDEFKIAANMGEDELRDPRELEKELKKERDKMEVQIEEAKKLLAEERRQMKLANVDVSDEEGGHGGRKKEKKKKKKVVKGVEVGGDEVEVMDEYDD